MKLFTVAGIAIMALLLAGCEDVMDAIGEITVSTDSLELEAEEGEEAQETFYVIPGADPVDFLMTATSR